MDRYRLGVFVAAFSLPPADEAIELVDWRYRVIFVRGLDVHLTLNLTISVFLTNTKMILQPIRCLFFHFKVFKMRFFRIKIGLEELPFRCAFRWETVRS